MIDSTIRKPNQAHGRWGRIGCAAAVVLTLAASAGVVWFVHTAYETAMDAERRGHSVWITGKLIARYLEENNGRWPRSWDDFSTEPVSLPLCRWPEDRVQMQAEVFVDFALDPATVDPMMPADQFSALDVRGAVPHTHLYVGRDEILFVLEQQAAKRQSTTAPTTSPRATPQTPR